MTDRTELRPAETVSEAVPTRHETPDVAELRRLAENATPGPWWHEWVDGDDWWAVYGQPTEDMVCPEVATLDREKWCTADAEFISHARTDLPRLAAAIEAVLDLHDHDDQFHCLTVKVIAAALNCADCWPKPRRRGRSSRLRRAWAAPTGYPCATILALDGGDDHA